MYQRRIQQTTANAVTDDSLKIRLIDKKNCLIKSNTSKHNFVAIQKMLGKEVICFNCLISSAY